MLTMLMWCCYQVDVYEVNVPDEVVHQLQSVVQELGIHIPLPVSISLLLLKAVA